MAYSRKSTIDLTTDTTTIPGDWTATANGWQISGGALVKKTGGTGTLYNQYSNTNKANSGEENQRIKFRFTPGSVVRGDIRFRWSNPASVEQYFQVYWGLGGSWDTISCSYRVGGGSFNTQASGSWGLTNGTQYDAEVTLEGTGASTVFTATIYNTSGTQVFQFILGTGGTAWTNSSNIPTSGDFRFAVDQVAPWKGFGGATYIEYLTEGTPPAATATVSDLNANQTTAGVTLAISGGVAPYSAAVTCNGSAISGSPFTIASAGSQTFTTSGLTAGTHNVFAWTITPTTGAAASSTADFFTEPIDLSYLRDNFNCTSVGDSITDATGNITIGSSTWTGQTLGEVAHSMVAGAIGGVIGTSLTTNVNRVAVSGYTSGQISSLATEVVDVVNGNYTGAHTTGSAHPVGKPAQVVTIRLGKNDTGTAAETVANIQTIVDAIRAGCAHNPWIILCRITGTQGSGAGNTAMSADRQYAANLLLDAKNDPDNRIVVEGMAAWWPGVLNPARIPDNVHPDATYRGILCMTMANTITNAILGITTSSSGSGSGGAEMTISASANVALTTDWQEVAAAAGKSFKFGFPNKSIEVWWRVGADTPAAGSEGEYVNWENSQIGQTCDTGKKLYVRSNGTPTIVVHTSA